MSLNQNRTITNRFTKQENSISCRILTDKADCSRSCRINSSSIIIPFVHIKGRRDLVILDHPFILLAAISFCHIIFLEQHVTMPVVHFHIMKHMFSIFNSNYRITFTFSKNNSVTIIPNNPVTKIFSRGWYAIF